ncbi:MAG TPA: hypothetical protein VKT76_16470 [Bradyrhizobium sp.]|nr:hypothetical protein [Bradyrhizobium sp.]
MYDAIADPYTYENSTVLVNKLGLREQAELDAFETEISAARALEALPEGALDFQHFKAVHHHLFQDVYEWAGLLADRAAYPLDMNKLQPAEMLEAMIASFDGDERKFVNIIESLEHDPEKCEAVFRKDHAPTKN